MNSKRAPRESSILSGDPKPVLCNTLVKDSEEECQAGAFELSRSAVYVKLQISNLVGSYAIPDVALFANFSDDLAEAPDGVYLAKNVLTFAPAWYISGCIRLHYHRR